MKAIIDKGACIGCGLCAEICPVVFELNGDGKVVTKVDIVPKNQQNKVNDAATSCPVNAIVVKGN